MKSIRVLSIIGLVIAVVAFLCLVAFDNVSDYESAVGWGIIMCLYSVAHFIVCLAVSGDKKSQ